MSCYGCSRRHLGCHDKCEEYQKEKEKRDSLREKEKKARAGYRALERSSFKGAESRIRGKRERRYGELG